MRGSLEIELPRKIKGILMKRFVFLVGALFLLAVIAALTLVRPGDSKAETAFEINGNGLLEYYNGDQTYIRAADFPPECVAIGDEAFIDNKSLEEIDLPGRVKAIGKRSFYGCENLRAVTINEGTQSIGMSAFALCKDLRDIYVPSTVRSIGAGAFAGDTSLDQLTLDSRNPWFFQNEGALYNLNSTRLIQFFPGNGRSSYNMPFTVKEIDPYAFWGTNDLKEVHVSNNVKGIDSFAFSNAAGLESAYLPNSVSYLDEYSFRDCKKLNYVWLENGGCRVDEAAFSGCREGFTPSYNGAPAVSIRDDKTGNENLETITEDSDSLESVSEGSVSDDSVLSGASVSGDSVLSGRSVSGDSVLPGASVSGGSVSGDAVEREDSQDRVSSDKEDNETDDSAMVKGRPTWGIYAPYQDIDKENPKGLIGTGRIVGGQTFIIPTGD